MKRALTTLCLLTLCVPVLAQTQLFTGKLYNRPYYMSVPGTWASYLMQLNVGGVPWFEVDKDGNLATHGTITANGQLLTNSLPNMSDWPAGLTLDELGRLIGVTSSVQDQLNAKAPLDNPNFTTGITTPSITVTGSVDGVDVSAHDHSSSTAQTRLALKDRARTLAWSIHNPDGSAWTPLPLPAYFCGDGSNIVGTSTPTGFLFPSNIEVRYLSVTARCEAPGGGLDPDPSLVLTLKRNTDVVATVTLTGDNIDSGWYRAAGTYAGGNAIPFTYLQGLSMTLAEGVVGGLWSTATVVLYYTTN
jgi:hypothetical protein